LILIGLRHANVEEKDVSKVLTTVAFLGVLAAAAPLLYAATSANSETRPEVTRAAGGGAVEPGQFRASRILGSAVYNAHNTKIGEVKDLILDKDGTVAAIIVDVAFVGFGNKYVAVSISDISSKGDHLTLDRTSAQLQQMASYKLENEEGSAGTSSPNSGTRLIIGPAH